MRGMESQQTWTVDAALSAFLGMVVVFLLWWWYFDGANAAEERHIRNDVDARRRHVWTYAHVPFYLGIVVTGVGVHHTIAVATVGHLHAAESWILSGALALTMVSLAAISGSRGAPYVLAGITLGLGAAGPLLPCSIVMAVFGAILMTQLRLSARPRGATEPAPKTTAGVVLQES
jgi:low temperature requirement protein LtrA